MKAYLATSLRVHVPKQGILGPRSTCYVGTLGRKCIVARYMDPEGLSVTRTQRRPLSLFFFGGGGWVPLSPTLNQKGHPCLFLGCSWV